MGEADGDKTHEPTPKRLEDAQRKGQTPFSREPAVLASLLVFSAWLAWGAGSAALNVVDLFQLVWMRAGELDLAAADMASLALALGGRVAGALAPVLVALMLAGLAAGLVQAEPRFVGERVRPQASRISPARGWTRIFGRRGWAEFAKSLVKIVAAGALAALVLRAALPDLAAFMRQPAGVLPGEVGRLVLRVVWSVAVLMLAVAVVDWAWSRRVWRQGLCMSRKDVSDETKQAEGDPILKARRRALARDRARRRMMEAVPTATLVIANPTHVAVALRYRHEEDPAPIVVAKGGDHLCARIRAAAADHDVPVFERIDLARALYKVAEIDRPIPHTFYRAVAELINFVMDPARAR